MDKGSLTHCFVLALADELVSVFQRCNERIRSKRHLASIKRDSNGVVIPSSVMSDRNNGVSLADLHNYVSSSHSIPTPPPPPPTLPTISFPPASVKIDIKTANEKLSIGASFDGAKVRRSGFAFIGSEF